MTFFPEFILQSSCLFPSYFNCPNYTEVNYSIYEYNYVTNLTRNKRYRVVQFIHYDLLKLLQNFLFVKNVIDLRTSQTCDFSLST